ERFEFSGIIGKSRKLQQVLEMIARVSTANTTVLIEGESGTGKELVAKAIHKNSPRAEKSFIVVNCAAISETLLESELFGYLKGAFTGAVSQKKGLFEEADQGTVFLDEIGEMSPATQAKILRVIQEGEVRRVGSTQTIQVDVRVIAATNKNLKELVKQHKFREDLYYRLKVFHIVVPPLRLRKGDVPELADYFLEKLSQGAGKRIVGITQEAMALLQNYPWPGNVRELENAIERAVIMTIGQHITPTDLPREIQFYEEPSAQNTSEWATLYEVEKQHILKTLEYYDWNLGKVTEVLGISRATLWRKLKEYGIQGKENK
ncbi:MAG TPA: sigma-54-dependent Fis family transcriptional regulator, partial [Bacteroidetes bacterium]|nr:sigma-54-dependent Fis family transcriptional regulator [Bacteroidota bacterium]